MTLEEFYKISKEKGGIQIILMEGATDYKVSSWFINPDKGSTDLVNVTLNRLTKYCNYFKISKQILYDVAILKIKSEKERPICKYCGEVLPFCSLREGYKKAHNGICRNLRIKETMSSPEFSNMCRQRALKQWTNNEYRELQTSSHKEWASNPENIESMSKITKTLWENSDYRKKQSDSHKKWISEHPDSVFGGAHHGKMDCCKTKQGSILFDSRWEEDFIKFCIDCNDILEISRSALLLEYEFDNIIYYYNPDFIVNYKGLLFLVEIKADWLAKDPRTIKKIEAGKLFVENQPELVKYLVIKHGDLYNEPSCKTINVTSLINLFN